jgi:hypothetical protein
MRKQFTWREPKRKQQAIFPVIIGHKKTAGTVVGAVYLTAPEAKAECERLNKSNNYTRAYYIRRVIEIPSGEV